MYRNQENSSFKTGLALSGGSAKGFAHLGVIKALDESGYYPDVISGVSAGAIVGAFYADGYHPEEILEMFIRKKLFQLVNPTLNRRGMMNQRGLTKLIKKHLRAKTFEDLNIPLYICVTDFNRGKAVYFNSGSLIDRITASASIPILFKPVIMDNTTYVDGGLVDNLPISPLRNKCKTLIGVNVNPHFEDFKTGSYKKMVERTFYLSLVSKTLEHKDECDLFIEPKGLRGFTYFEISKAREMFEIGYNETLKQLKG